ncbi:short neurotoxin 1-like [Macrobrachium rosenbergii]|uniref:short neurotoxin 1-like n=1 Tax=Macrobrachium rosenbergii TaxID=79674 RepID=UPI0034D65662
MFTIPKTTLIALVLVTLSVAQIGYCLKCYFSEGDGTLREIECSGSCIKVDISEGPDAGTSYGCDPIKHQNNCSSIQLGGHPATVCFCDNDLCNSSNAMHITVPLLFLSFFLKMLV